MSRSFPKTLRIEPRLCTAPHENDTLPQVDVRGCMNIVPSIVSRCFFTYPSIPSSWDGFEIKKLFRGKWLNITVDNKAHVQSGVKEVIINGTKAEGDFIAASALKDNNDITVVMG